MSYDPDLNDVRDLDEGVIDEELPVPPPDEDLHAFQPRRLEGVEADEITSGCSCGWTGGSYLIAEEGYQEALEEHREHVVAAADEPEPPS